MEVSEVGKRLKKFQFYRLDPPHSVSSISQRKSTQNDCSNIASCDSNSQVEASFEIELELERVWVVIDQIRILK